MATRTTPASVDQYIASFPAGTQRLLKQLRKTIKAAAPGADEVISYGIAGYKYQGMLIFFAGFSNHVSVYPAPRSAPEFKKELAAYKGGKGTVQFALDQPLPLDLVKRMVKYRVQQNLEKAGIRKQAVVKTTENPSSKTRKPDPADPVTAWLNKQNKKLKQEVEAVRKIIIASSPKLHERIKWNAPSYYYSAGQGKSAQEQDIVTFGPYRNNRLLLVFHHPAVVKIRSSLLQGDYKDRRLVYFNNKTEAVKNKTELKRIIAGIITIIAKQ